MRWKVEVVEDAPHVVARVVRIVEAETWRDALAFAAPTFPMPAGVGVDAQITVEMAR